MSKETPTYADVQFLDNGNTVSEKRFDLYKTKLGVRTSDMWYAIVCYTNDDFALASSIEEWAKTAPVGNTYASGKVRVTIAK